MTRPGDTVQEKLKELRKVFSAQLPEKIRQIEEALNGLNQDEWDPGKAEQAAQLLHTLAGTAGTFGFSAIRTAAKGTEALLRTSISNSGIPGGSVPAKITEQLVALKASCEDAVVFKSASQVTAQAPFPIGSDNDTVFVVDNDPLFTDGLALQLRCYGYRVDAFSTFVGLTNALKVSTPLLIIMCLSFLEDQPEGSRAIAELQQGRTSPIPLIFLSDRIDFNARLQAVRSGGYAYFVKPVDVGRLVDCLDMLTTRIPRLPFRILIVDDEPLLADYHATVLQQAGMAAAVVTDPEQTLESLIDFRPELILMDVYMPGCSGMELASVIRQDETYIDIPIVYLSSETDVNRQLAAMGSGGDDFLTKPIRADHLISSVTSRAERYRILRRFMIRDSLTGLLNHSRTKEQLDIEVARAQRTKSSLAFAIIDIDHFKSVNDTYGHYTGDQVIKNLSRLLQQRLRKTDTIGRYGGEEFAVILADMDASGAMKVLDSIRQDFGRISHQAKEVGFSVTFSCGIAAFQVHKTAGELNEAADAALYRAKSKGRNCIHISQQDNN
ncbi:MAG: diguanylate cyclase [Nitrospirota bacterium]|nr:diguanylate cyclase [Nitrospirota bacterium]